MQVLGRLYQRPRKHFSHDHVDQGSTSECKVCQKEEGHPYIFPAVKKAICFDILKIPWGKRSLFFLLYAIISNGEMGCSVSESKSLQCPSNSISASKVLASIRSAWVHQYIVIDVISQSEYSLHLQQIISRLHP